MHENNNFKIQSSLMIGSLYLQGGKNVAWIIWNTQSLPTEANKPQGLLPSLPTTLFPFWNSCPLS